MKRKPEYYWKVVVSENGEYKSVATKDTDLELKYKIGKRTKPIVGKIFVFKSREMARQFKKQLIYDSTYNYKILKVKTIGHVEEGFYRAWPTERDIYDFWTWPSDRYGKCGHGIPTFTGTYFADAVLPIEVVK